jgi:hypothetical protein
MTYLLVATSIWIAEKPALAMKKTIIENSIVSTGDYKMLKLKKSITTTEISII